MLLSRFPLFNIIYWLCFLVSDLIHSQRTLGASSNQLNCHWDCEQCLLLWWSKVENSWSDHSLVRSTIFVNAFKKRHQRTNIILTFLIVTTTSPATLIEILNCWLNKRSCCCTFLVNATRTWSDCCLAIRIAIGVRAASLLSQTYCSKGSSWITAWKLLSFYIL